MESHTVEEGVAGSLSLGRGTLPWTVTWQLPLDVLWPKAEVTGLFWEPQAHGISWLFQERIFLTVSNYIFTAIFVGEMTLKVAPVFIWDLSHPQWWVVGLALAQPSLGLSLTCWSATFH